MVDVHPDPRLSDDQRLDPAGSRRIEMRVEAVVAETQRNASCGKQMIVFDPSPSCAGTMVKAGAGRCAAGTGTDTQ